MKNVLSDSGVDNIILKNRNSIAIDSGLVDCDYYDFLRHIPYAVNAYHGEYMRQYSWVETGNAQLSSIKMANIAVCDSGTGLWLCKAGESNCGSCLSWGRELRCGRGQ